MQPRIEEKMLKMEASTRSATSTEEKEPSAALPRTISARVQQLLEVGDHLDGCIWSSMLFSSAAPTCSPATQHVHVSTKGGVQVHG